MKRTIRGFISTFALMSRIPVRNAEKPEAFHAALFIPVVGIVAAVLSGGAYWLCRLVIGDVFLIALLVLLVQYLAFNLFHFDGFVDTIDAAFVWASREKRLAILKDVHIGAYALFFGVFYLVSKIYLLARALEQAGQSSAAVLLLFCYPVAGRIAASLQAWCQAPARSEGLSSSIGRFKATPTLVGAFAGLLPAALLVLWLPVPYGLYGGFLSIPITLGVGMALYRRIAGGVTGDGLGFSIELGELLYLVLFLGAAALPPTRC